MNPVKSRFHALWLVLAAFSALFSGCASPTQPSAMSAPPPVSPARQHPGDVSLAVTGGKATNPMWTSQISDEDFGEALRQSLLSSGLFTGVVEGRNGKYHLTAFLSRLDQPMMGFAMTVTMEVGYTLTDPATGKTLWQKSIVSSHTASTGDAIVGVKRLRLATEGAARKNIEQLLVALGGIELP